MFNSFSENSQPLEYGAPGILNRPEAGEGYFPLRWEIHGRGCVMAVERDRESAVSLVCLFEELCAGSRQSRTSAAFSPYTSTSYGATQKFDTQV